MKKLLGLNDLYDFYVKQNKNIKFSSKESDASIVVHVDEPFQFKKVNDGNGKTRFYMWLCHIDKNRNQSSIPEKAMKNAMGTAYNMPILGYIYDDPETGEPVFAGHEFYEQDGEYVYEEVPVGVIPESSNLKLVEEEDHGKIYLEGEGIVWRTYSKAAEILEREEELSVSVELNVNELEFNAKEKVLELTDFEFEGVTILQKSRKDGSDIAPGMEGAHISIESFSKKNNSMFSDISSELVNELRKFNKNFEAFNSNFNEKTIGKEEMPMDSLEILMKVYEVTEDQIDFETEGLSDEELEDIFKEKFGTKEAAFEDTESDSEAEEESTGDTEDGEENTPADGVEEEFAENTEEAENEAETEESEEVEETEESEDETVEETEEITESQYSLILPDGTKKEFSLSLNDVQTALYNLVNDTYAELDNTVYMVDVYPDDKQVIMQDWFSGNNAYRQNYSRRKDNFALEGDRVGVHAVWMSEDEEKAFENMKANYSSTVEELAQFKAEPEKVELLESEAYSKITETDEYKELVKEENHFSIDTKELEEKLDSILLNYAKNNKLNFASESEKTEKTVKRKGLARMKSSKRSRYGNLFKK